MLSKFSPLIKSTLCISITLGGSGYISDFSLAYGVSLHFLNKYSTPRIMMAIGHTAKLYHIYLTGLCLYSVIHPYVSVVILNTNASVGERAMDSHPMKLNNIKMRMNSRKQTQACSNLNNTYDIDFRGSISGNDIGISIAMYKVTLAHFLVVTSLSISAVG